jgi:uncharacterized protein (DUF697 family)
MSISNRKIAGIIHGTSACCAAIGGGLAQVPGSDSVAITPLQVAMISAIADQHGQHLPKDAAAKLLLPFAASITGRATSSLLLGWLPGFGNFINACTAAGITEAIGWAADGYFKKENIA